MTKFPNPNGLTELPRRRHAAVGAGVVAYGVVDADAARGEALNIQ